MNTFKFLVIPRSTTGKIRMALWPVRTPAGMNNYPFLQEKSKKKFNFTSLTGQIRAKKE